MSCLFTGGLGPGGQEGLIKNIMEKMMSGVQAAGPLEMAWSSLYK